MRILKFLNNRSVGDRKGQVAIFVALIFQLLFLFFAMVVNVGLLVHHKINLQNSVDLAAYYGGMKQAEVLNAIAHINYQIRQSYKVLAWRYRVLGTAGVNPDDPRNPKNPPVNPVKKVGDPKNQGGQITGLESNGVDWNSSDPNVDKLHTAPAFCISYEPFAETPTGESICKAAAGQTIDALVKPTVVASFIGAVSSAAALTDIANVAAKNDCEYNHYINYYLLAKFLAAYQVDQAQRKALIFHLANNLSTSTSEFLDINGDNASQGIQATLKNNLTAANQDGLVGSPSVFNSLAAGGCGGSGSDFQPPNWLSEIVTYLWANYITCNGSSGGTNYSVANVNVSPADQQIINPQFSALRQADLNLYQFLNSNFAGANSIYRASLGVEKNPWCMAYVGVSAQSEPKIPFSLGTVRLKATGFAKPFGGKIGPWYGNTFPRSAGAESTAGQLNQRADALWPIRCIKGDFSQCLPPLGVQNQPTVNHSRFPGDQAGLAASSVQAEFGKSLFDLGAAPSIKFWTDIEVPQNQRNPNEYDILAWTNDPTKSRSFYPGVSNPGRHFTIPCNVSASNMVERKGVSIFPF